ncbi:MAG TPA: hypothetical protein VF522_09605 [Ramlibacter sp.]|uniref:hypothetical protein n=1 Tax=Ramlibacter sp. TaxID=1917967 RepID=UPI002ED44119
MDARALRTLLLAATVAIALPPAAGETVAPSCELPASDVDPFTDRAGILARYERLPPACLYEIFLACSAAANESLLDFGTAAVCSFGYEALLSQGFGGNFRALMAWWRTQQGHPTQ